MRNFCKALKEMQLTSESPRNAACFGKSKPRYFMYIGTGSEETWKFAMTAHKESGNKLAKQVTDVFFVQKHPILKGCRHFH